MIFNSETKVLIISHFLINPIKNNSAFSTMCRQYLKDKLKTVVQIEHPFPESRDKNSFFKKFEKGSLVKTEKIISFKLGPLAYLWHVFSTYYMLLSLRTSYDLIITCDNLSAFILLPFRKVGFAKKLIFYSVDYSERRFGNKLLNNIYHIVDRFVCKHSDEIWVISKQGETARYKNGLRKNKTKPFKVVPIGFDESTIKRTPLSKVNRNNILFMGAVRESAGPEVAIKALPYIRKVLPKITLTILGNGEYLKVLKKQVEDLKLSSSVKFLKGVESHSTMIRLITKHSLGVAPYVAIPGSISYYSDPGKIKLYTLCGLPVITTNIATSGKKLEDAGAGIVSGFEPKDVAKNVLKIIKSKNTYKVYKKRATKWGQEFDIKKILDKAFLDYEVYK